MFTCITTGVSGSGKSSLLNETLAPALRRQLDGGQQKPGNTKVSKAYNISTSSSRSRKRRSPDATSNPATYTGVFDEIRKVFAQPARLVCVAIPRAALVSTSPAVVAKSAKPGLTRIEMNFLPDLWGPCAMLRRCPVQSPNARSALSRRTIADVLDMSVSEAVAFFENFPLLRRLLESLDEVGLGYVRLGQACTTLSGGEAQRIKLATELARVDTGNTLYLLDEPTTGLHFEDIRRLLAVLQRLGRARQHCDRDRAQSGRNQDRRLDHRSRAEGGAGGGRIIADGTPEQIAAIKGNSTGEFLRPLLNPA